MEVHRGGPRRGRATTHSARTGRSADSVTTTISPALETWAQPPSTPRSWGWQPAGRWWPLAGGGGPWDLRLRRRASLREPGRTGLRQRGRHQRLTVFTGGLLRAADVPRLPPHRVTPAFAVSRVRHLIGHGRSRGRRPPAQLPRPGRSALIAPIGPGGPATPGQIDGDGQAAIPTIGLESWRFPADPAKPASP